MYFFLEVPLLFVLHSYISLVWWASLRKALVHL